ncbi:MAG: class I SAM-dependent methyltransferase [Thermomicrobiales bacterium]
MIRAMLAEAGRPIESLRCILDFGCGCGRIMRRWHAIEGPTLYGTDDNPDLVEWCKTNLPFANFAENAVLPPLPYEENRFDFIYAFSVFTHLPEEAQYAWMEELRRVLAPGGLLLITVHGKQASRRLPPHERRRFDRGELIVRYEEGAGTNLCNAFHPRSWVIEKLARGFDLVGFIEEDFVRSVQDFYVFSPAQKRHGAMEHL